MPPHRMFLGRVTANETDLGLKSRFFQSQGIGNLFETVTAVSAIESFRKKEKGKVTIDTYRDDGISQNLSRAESLGLILKLENISFSSDHSWPLLHL